MDDKRGGVFRAAVIGSSSDRWLGQGFTSWVLGGVVGSLNLDGNPAFKRFDAFTTQLQGTYGALNLNLVREQSFNRAWSARWLLLGQWALTNLSGYEQCGLGWPNGVRAYPPGENSSSSCLVSQVDLNWRLRPWLKLIGFADLAWGERWRQPFPGSLQPNSYGLAGAGIGFDLGRTGSWLVSLRAASRSGAIQPTTASSIWKPAIPPLSSGLGCSSGCNRGDAPRGAQCYSPHAFGLDGASARVR